MDRKLFRSGNSVVVALPREAIESLGMREGDMVTVEVERDTQQIILTPANRSEIPGVDQRFDRQVAEFIEQYRPALAELARQ